MKKWLIGIVLVVIIATTIYADKYQPPTTKPFAYSDYFNQKLNTTSSVNFFNIGSTIQTPTTTYQSLQDGVSFNIRQISKDQRWFCDYMAGQIDCYGGFTAPYDTRLFFMGIGEFKYRDGNVCTDNNNFCKPTGYTGVCSTGNLQIENGLVVGCIS